MFTIDKEKHIEIMWIFTFPPEEFERAFFSSYPIAHTIMLLLQSHKGSVLLIARPALLPLCPLEDLYQTEWRWNGCYFDRSRDLLVKINSEYYVP